MPVAVSPDLNMRNKVAVPIPSNTRVIVPIGNSMGGNYTAGNPYTPAYAPPIFQIDPLLQPDPQIRSKGRYVGGNAIMEWDRWTEKAYRGDGWGILGFDAGMYTAGRVSVMPLWLDLARQAGFGQNWLIRNAQQGGSSALDWSPGSPANPGIGTAAGELANRILQIVTDPNMKVDVIHYIGGCWDVVAGYTSDQVYAQMNWLWFMLRNAGYRGRIITTCDTYIAAYAGDAAGRAAVENGYWRAFVKDATDYPGLASMFEPNPDQLMFNLGVGYGAGRVDGVHYTDQTAWHIGWNNRPYLNGLVPKNDFIFDDPDPNWVPPPVDEEEPPEEPVDPCAECP